MVAITFVGDGRDDPEQVTILGKPAQKGQRVDIDETEQNTAQIEKLINNSHYLVGDQTAPEPEPVFEPEPDPAE